MFIRKFEQYFPDISSSAFIDPSAIIIGQVKIAEYSSIWPLCVVRGDIHHIHIGARTNIQDGSVLHVTHKSAFNPKGFPLEIGDDVTIGHQVILHGCKILGLSLVGMGSKVLDGAIIEPEVIVGAGSLVSQGKVLESGYLWLGSPAKKIRPLTQEEKNFLKYSAEHYAKLGQQHGKSL